MNIPGLQVLVIAVAGRANRHQLEAIDCFQDEVRSALLEFRNPL